MAELSFETICFKEQKDKVKVILLQHFYFEVDKAELKQISPFEIKENKIDFLNLNKDKAQKKFSFLLAKHLPELKNDINQNPAVYVHSNSNLPLIGNVSFGIVYRNTSLIEIKPQTSCNLNCVYCSVGEGINSKKTDFVVEKDYLVSGINQLLEFVEESVEIHIGTHGEPFLYADCLNLIPDLDKIKSVHTISIDTNGTLLTESLIDRLAQWKKLRLNVSLNTLTPDTAKKMSGVTWYNVERIKEMVLYAQKKKVKVLLTPLILPTYNDSEIEELVKWAKEHNFPLGVQNFLSYKTGRNPIKPWDWEKFYSTLTTLEKKYQVKLVISPDDFKIKYTPELEKPFLKDETINAIIVCSDRFPNSRLAVAKERTISLPDCN